MESSTQTERLSRVLSSKLSKLAPCCLVSIKPVNQRERRDDGRTTDYHYVGSTATT